MARFLSPRPLVRRPLSPRIISALVLTTALAGRAAWTSSPAAAAAPAHATHTASMSRSVSRSEPVDPAAMEARFMALLNQERTRRGLRPLAWDPSLCQAGRQHSQEMARLNYFDHTSPVRGFETPADRWERCTSRTPVSYTIGENLFYGSVPNPAWGHRSLMESPPHRENILNPEYAHVGVGVYVAKDGEMWVTEMFLS